MKTGNTHAGTFEIPEVVVPQWSPVMKTGNTSPDERVPPLPRMPQWSPVMKTGNTAWLVSSDTARA